MTPGGEANQIRCRELQRKQYLLAALILLLTESLTAAQEFDPRDPVSLNEGAQRADLIVVGTFQDSRCYPWFDGWRCRGELRIEEVLYGNRKTTLPIEFHWKERYGPNCLPCDRISQINGNRGIWLLKRSRDTYEFSGTTATLCRWSLHLDCRDAVREAIKNRTR